VDKTQDGAGNVCERVHLRVEHVTKHGAKIARCTASAPATAARTACTPTVDEIGKAAVDELPIPPAKQTRNTGRAEPNLVHGRECGSLGELVHEQLRLLLPARGLDDAGLVVPTVLVLAVMGSVPNDKNAGGWLSLGVWRL
jgi:hypothetical protein